MFIRSYRVSNLLIWSCVASCGEFCLFRSSRLNISEFWLDPCIVNKGGCLCMLWALGSIWKVFKVVWTVFGKVCVQGGQTPWGGLTGPGRRFYRPGQRASVCSLTCISKLHFRHWSKGSVLWLNGACICVGELLCEFVVCLLWWPLLHVWACFCLGCAEPLPLPKGIETFLLQVILFFSLPSALLLMLRFIMFGLNCGGNVICWKHGCRM
jgi:hypothetical protein